LVVRQKDGARHGKIETYIFEFSGSDRSGYSDSCDNLVDIPDTASKTSPLTLLQQDSSASNPTNLFTTTLVPLMRRSTKAIAVLLQVILWPPDLVLAAADANDEQFKAKSPHEAAAAAPARDQLYTKTKIQFPFA
jgi:hypothetical protein